MTDENSQLNEQEQRKKLLQEIAFERKLFSSFLDQTNTSYVLYDEDFSVIQYVFCDKLKEKYGTPERFTGKIKEELDKFDKSTKLKSVFIAEDKFYFSLKIKEIEIVQEIYYLFTIECLNDSERINYRFVNRLFDNSIYGILYFNNQLTILDSNQRFKEILGLENQKISGLNLERFKHEIFFDSLEQTLDGEKSILEFRYLLPNKREVFISLHVSPVYGVEENNVIGGVAILDDITDRKISEMELTKHQELYSYFFNYSPVGILFYDTNLKIEHFNQQFADIIGTPHHKLLNLDMRTIKDQSVVPALEKTLKGENGEYLGNYVTTYGGKKLFVSFRTFPMFHPTEKNKVVSGIGILTDFTEQRKIENQLQLSKMQFDIAIENSPDAISISEFKAGKYIQINKGFEYISGYTKDFVLNKTSVELGIWMSEQDRKNFISCIYKDGYVSNKEVRMKLSENRIRTMLLTSHVIQINGQAHLMTIARDIEDIKNLKISEKEAKQRYKAYFKSAPDGIAIINSEGKIKEANSKILIDSLVNESDITHVELSRFYDSTFDWQSFFSNVKNEGKGHTEIYKITKERKMVWVWLEIAKVFDNEYIVFEKNIDNRKRIENKYRQFKIISDSSNIGHIVVNKAAEILYINNHYAFSLGFSSSEMIGKKVTDFFSDQDRQDIKELSRKLWANRKLQGEIVMHQKRNKQKIPMLVSGIVVEQFDTEPYVTLSAIDVTEQIEMETSLRHAIAKAQEADHLKTAFLSNMSHEIRTPMNGILGFAEILKDPNLSHEHRVEYIDFIDRSGQHLLEIIDDIIDIAKIEANQLRIFKTEFDLVELLQGINKLFIGAKKQRNKDHITIKLDTPDQNLNVLSDRTRINQIFTNLIGNALKFTDKGQISFGYEISNPGTIKCFVSDTGIGIVPEQLEIIFDRFRQAEDFMSKKFEGTGLGLSISKGLIELLGGKIWAESESGVGTTFYFTIEI